MEPKNVPAGVDMNLIREALARRQATGNMSGGNPIPMARQMTPPSAANPATGMANRPVIQPPTTPPAQVPSPSAAPNVPPQLRQMAAKVSRAGQAAQGANFDDDTKRIAKTLVSKLISYL